MTLVSVPLRLLWFLFVCFLIVLCVYGFAGALYVCHGIGSQKRVSKTLELTLQTVVGHSARTRTPRGRAASLNCALVSTHPANLGCENM